MTHLTSVTTASCEGCETCSSESTAKPKGRYEILRADLEQSGCFERAPLHYLVRATLSVAAVATGYVGMWMAAGWAAFVAFAVLAAVATVQAAFVAHEIGDGALTKNKSLSKALNQFVMTFMTGTSASYFDHVHHLHHQVILRPPKSGRRAALVENRYEFKGFKSLVSRNGTLFAAVMLLARGVLFRLETLRFLRANPKSTRADVVALFAHYLVWFVAPAFVFGAPLAALAWISVALMAGPYIGFVLVINHESMSRAELLTEKSKVERVIATTRNLPTGRLNDIVLGGVNNHIEHHLFPTMPGAHLPKARRIVEARLAEWGVPYTVSTVSGAAKQSLRHFKTMSPEERVTAAIA